MRVRSCVKTPGLPYINGGAANSAGDQANVMRRVLCGHGDAKRKTWSHTGYGWLVKMQGMPGRHPVIFLVQHEKTRRALVCTFSAYHAPASHIGLTNE